MMIEAAELFYKFLNCLVLESLHDSRDFLPDFQLLEADEMF